jgi:hypothetical protein
MSLRKAAALVACILILGASAGVVCAQQQSSDQNTKPQSVAEAARKARQESKNEPKAAKTYTNDSVEAIKEGGISRVGSSPATPPAQNAAAAAKPATAPEPPKGEEYWRKRFSDARQKLATAEKELDIMQRELNLSQTQYYSDPNKSLQQQYSREEINDKTAKIDAKKQEVADLKQALSDLTDELRRAGGQPGWAN